MLQWMGGSRRKLAASNRSIHNRQKQYFEQRKRQQQTVGQQNNTNERNKRTHYAEEPRSLDVLSLINLATGRQDHPSCKLGSELGSVCLGKTSPTFKPQDASTTHKNAGEVDGLKLPASHNDFPFKSTDTEHKQQKANGSNDVSILDLLGDDGPKCSSEGKSIHEAHVAFSVEGLGKVGTETPPHSPRLRGREAPPKISKWIRRTEHRKSIPYDIRSDLNASLHDINVADEGDLQEFIYNSRGKSSDLNNTRSTMFKVSCASPNACEIGNYNDEIFLDYKEGDKEQPWKTRFDILDENIDAPKFDSAWKSKSCPTEDHPSFRSKVRKSRAYDRDPLSPDIRTLFKARKKPDVSVSSTPCVKHIRRNRDYDPVSFDWEDNESSGFASMFTQPDWSFLEIEDSQNDMSLLSEESCSSTADWEGRNYEFESRSVKAKENKINQRNRHHISRERKYVAEKFYAAETMYSGIDETPWEEIPVPRRNFGNMTNQWSSKAYSSERLGLFEPDCMYFDREDYSSPKVSSAPSSSRTSKATDKKFFSCMLVQEDNLFDMFPAAELHPTVDFMNKQSKLKIPDNDESSEFMFDTDILKEISDPGVQLQKAVSHPMDTESHFPYIYGAGGFRFEKDTQFPDFSSPRKDNVDQLRAETAQAEDSAGKKSLSSVNSGTAVDADCKRNCSKNEESNGENKEQFEEPTNRDPPSETEETPAPMEEASTQPTIYMQDKVDHCNDNSPVPSQIKSKEPMEEKMEAENIFSSKGGGSKDPSYQVMLESYVLQLLCVQKVLLDASGKDIKRGR